MQIFKCPQCMKDIKPDMNFCPFCGFDQKKPQKEYALPRNTILHGRYLVGNNVELFHNSGDWELYYVGLDLKSGRKVTIKEDFVKIMADSIKNNALSRNTYGKLYSYKLEPTQGISPEMKKMQHMNLKAVVRDWDAFNENETGYTITDYTEGISLFAYVKLHGTLTWEESLRILMPIMDDLAVLNDSGIIYRYLSPENIMLRADGTALLSDPQTAHREAEGEYRIEYDIDGEFKSVTCFETWESFVFAFSDVRAEIMSAGRTNVYGMAATLYYCLSAHYETNCRMTFTTPPPISPVIPPGKGIPSHVEVVLRKALENEMAEAWKTKGNLGLYEAYKKYAEKTYKNMREFQKALLNENGR